MSFTACVLALALAVLYSCTPAAAAAPLPVVKFLVPGHFNSDHRHAAAPAFGYMSNETLSGIAAAFLEQNSKVDGDGNHGVRGRNMTFLTFEDLGLALPSHAAAVAQLFATQPDVTAMLAPGPITTLYSNPIGRAMRVPTLAPMSIRDEDYESGGGKPNGAAGADTLLHLRLDLRTEASALLNFAVNSDLLCKRFMITYVADILTPAQLRVILQVIEALGFPDPMLAELPVATDTAAVAAAFPRIVGAFAAAEVRPSCVIILTDAAYAVRLISMLHTQVPNFDAANTFFLTTSQAALPRWSVAGSSAFFGNLYQSQQFPHPADTRYTFIRKYHAAMAKLRLSNTYEHGATFVPNFFSVEGYAAGRFAAEALRKHSNGKAPTRASLLQAIYDAKVLMIDELAMGQYSNGCVGHQPPGSPACHCNSGNRRLFFTKVNGASGVPEPVFDTPQFPGIAELTIAPSDCGLSSTFLKPPHVAAVPLDPAWVATDHSSAASMPTFGWNDAATRATAAAAMQRHISAAIVAAALKARTDGWLDQGPVYTTAPTSSNFTHASLEKVDQRYRVVVLVGAAVDQDRVYPSPGQSSSWTAPFLDIAPLGAAFRDRDAAVLPAAQHNHRRIAFYPALVDFTMTAAALIAQEERMRGSQVAVSVIADTAGLLGLAAKCVETQLRRGTVRLSVASNDNNPFLSVPAPPSQPAPTGGPLSDAVLIVVTRDPQLIVGARAFAAAAASVSVLLCADEFALEAAAANTTTSMWPGNLFFTSGLDSYDGGGGSATKAYAASVADVVLGLYSLRTNGTAAAMADAAFRNGAVRAGTVSIAPLHREPCAAVDKPTWPHPGGQCQCSKGLSQFFVRRSSEVAPNASSAPPLFAFRHDSCGVKFTDLPPDSSSDFGSKETAIVVAAAVVGIVGISGGVFTLIAVCSGSTKDNRRAPKDATKPFAMAFTDIQSSTKLWAQVPEQMGAALDAHHALMRQAVRKHNGYEVKTIGDSFMVAFTDPLDALGFCNMVQRELYDHDCGTTAFDDVYRETTREALIAAGGEVAASADLSLDEYSVLWSGLRVRVGLHVGIGDIKYDETANSYDYYGTVVNTAARVEGVGHGGQVLLTDAAMRAVRTRAAGEQLDPTAFAVTAGSKGSVGEERVMELPAHLGVSAECLGPQPLRGLPDPVVLYQVTPCEFAGRTYPPLRLDVENEAADEDSPEFDSAADSLDLPKDTPRRGKATYHVHNQALSEVSAASDGGAEHATPEALCFDIVKRLRVPPLQQQSAAKLSAELFHSMTTLLAALSKQKKPSLIAELGKAWRVDGLKAQLGPRFRRAERSLGRDGGTLLLTIIKVAQAMKATDPTGHISPSPAWLGSSQTSLHPSVPVDADRDRGERPST